MLSTNITLCFALLLFGCESKVESTVTQRFLPVNEKWIGYWQYPSQERKYPIYFELKITDRGVSGKTLEKNGDITKIKGAREGNEYVLTAHPIQQGDSKEEDVVFRGQRSGDTMTGTWTHFVGAEGPWRVEVTNLEAEPALSLE